MQKRVNFSFKKLKSFLIPVFMVASFLVFSQNTSASTSNQIFPVFSSNINNPTVNLSAGSGYSSNWAGYTSTNGTYTSVSGSWVIPSVQTSQTMSADATWVGIGGINSNDLIQVGTQNIENYNGQNVYQAWFELLPQGNQTIPVTVNPGDSISVSINETSTNVWNISFKDNTNGQNYSTTVNYTSSHSSAEWIEEMPTDANSNSFIPLDNFNSVQFTGAYATQNGTSLNLGQLGASTITMINSSNQVVSSPSSLGNDEASFTVTRSSNTPASSGNSSWNGFTRRTFKRGGAKVQGYNFKIQNKNREQRDFKNQFGGQFSRIQFKFSKNFFGNRF